MMNAEPIAAPAAMCIFVALVMLSFSGAGVKVGLGADKVASAAFAVFEPSGIGVEERVDKVLVETVDCDPSELEDVLPAEDVLSVEDVLAVDEEELLVEAPGVLSILSLPCPAVAARKKRFSFFMPQHISDVRPVPQQ